MLAFPEQPKWLPLATLGQGVAIKGDGPSSQQAYRPGTIDEGHRHVMC